MQHTDSSHIAGEKPVGNAIQRIADGLCAFFNPRARARNLALLSATATLLVPGMATAQDLNFAAAAAPPAATDTDLVSLPMLGTFRLSTLFASLGLSPTGMATTPAPAFPTYADLQLNIDAPAWENDPRFAELVLDAETGEIVYERNGLAARHIASITKVMTAYLVFEALAKGTLTPETELTASSLAASQGGMRMNLRRGQRVTVHDALNALITVSANDAAVLLAEGLAGTEANFAERMTTVAHRIGAIETTFASASGRFGDDSTAYDTALIFRQVALDYPEHYRQYFTENCTWCDNAGINATGRKTGTRSVAGYNVAVSVEHAGRTYIIVGLGARNNAGRFGRAIELAHAVENNLPSVLQTQQVNMAAAEPIGPTAVRYTASASIPGVWQR